MIQSNGKELLRTIGKPGHGEDEEGYVLLSAIDFFLEATEITGCLTLVLDNGATNFLTKSISEQISGLGLDV